MLQNGCHVSDLMYGFIVFVQQFHIIQCCQYYKYHSEMTNYNMIKLITRIIKNILKEYVGQNRKKSTGTSWDAALLWQKNEIPLPHNNRT